MGLKGLMSAMGMNGYALLGLVISFTAFVAILIWIWTRPQREIEDQARLCIDDDDTAPAHASDDLKDSGND